MTALKTGCKPPEERALWLIELTVAEAVGSLHQIAEKISGLTAR
jgi:hypothetical protein